MKNLLIQINDHDQFLTTYDYNTTPTLLAKLIQDANYFENFHLCEMFYFKIKDTQYYFSNRNTQIYKYLNSIDVPTLVFYRGLNGQLLLEKQKKIEDEKINTGSKQYQENDISYKISQEIKKTKNNPEQIKASEEKPQTQPQQKKNLISIVDVSSQYNQTNQQNLVSNEGINDKNNQNQQSGNYQQVKMRQGNTFDSNNQYSGAVNKELPQQEPFIRPSTNQQENNQQSKSTANKQKYSISLEATYEQFNQIQQFLHENNIKFEKIK